MISLHTAGGAAHNLQPSAQSLLWPLSQPGLKVVDLCLVYSLQELGAELQVISDFQVFNQQHKSDLEREGLLKECKASRVSFYKDFI